MINGNRVRLIALNDECFELTLKWINDPDIRMFTGAKFPVTKQEHIEWFRDKSLSKFNKTFAIQLIETNEIIGLIGNSDYDSISRSTNLFIYIGEKKYHGQGFGSEAFLLEVKFCINELNARRLYGYIFDYNYASKKMFEKCGFVIEGVLKQHWYKDGKYHDVLVMGMVRTNE